MRINGFLGPTYLGRSTNFQSDRTINFIPELNAAPDPKTVIALFGTPGTKKVLEAGQGPIRGSHVFNGVMFFVSGNALYSMSTGEVASSVLGTLATDSGPVYMVDNGLKTAGIGGNQLAIVDGASLYIFDVTTDVFTQLTETWTPSHIAYIDGYFVVIDKNTMSYYVSDLYDGLTWNSLATSPVSASPTNLVACCTPHQELWLVKEFTTEVWYNTGATATDTGSPFQRIPGAVIDYGTVALGSVVVGENTVFMLGQTRVNNEPGPVGVIQFVGYTANPITPPSISYRMNHMTSVSDAIAWMYAHEGHTFYIITFPTDGATFVYDTTTQMWHERSSYQGSGTPYAIGRHITNSLSFFNRKHYIGSYIDGTIYEMGSDYYDDDGDPIVSTRITPSLSDKDDMDNVFIHRLQVDAETGVGLSDGIDPEAELSWSNDGGHTFQDAYTTPFTQVAKLGAQGYYKAELKWRRLGYSRNRVWNLTISAKVKKVILGAVVEASQ